MFTSKKLTYIKEERKAFHQGVFL